MSTDENPVQKLDVNSDNNHFFKHYRARDALNRLTSIFENNNPFNRPKGRSLGNSSPKINPYLKHSQLDQNGKAKELKPPSVIVTPRNRTYFQQLLASKQVPDDEHPILIKNNHGKLSDFVKPFRPLTVTLSELANSISISSRTTASLLDMFNKNTSTSKRANLNTSKESASSSKENDASSSEDMKTSTQPTVFDDETDIFNHKDANKNLNYTSLVLGNKDEDRLWNSSANIVKPIRDWNNRNHLAHLNNHLAHHHTVNGHNHNHNGHLSSATGVPPHSVSKSTASPIINHRLTTGSSHKHTTMLSPHRTPAHMIITKKGNYTTNNSSKYFATPSYGLEKKKPVRFSLKPVVVSTGDSDRKQQVYTENDNPIKVNSYEDLDFVYSTTAMPSDSSYESGLNIKHPDHPQLIVHSSQHLKNPFGTKSNVSLSAGWNSQRNNTKIANISKWPLKNTVTKIHNTNQHHNHHQNHTTKGTSHPTAIYQSLVTSSSTSSEEDDSFTQLQSQHQASKNPHSHNYNYSTITQRPVLQVTQLNGVYTKPDSESIHSDAITVIDHDSSEQQFTQPNQQTSTTIMHNNLIVSYKPGRPLPGEPHYIFTTPSSYIQQTNEQISQSNILTNKNDVKRKPDHHQKLPSSPVSNTKTNYTLSKLPKPPIKHRPNPLNIPNKTNSLTEQQATVQQQSIAGALQPPRRVGVLPFSQQQEQIHQQQLISSNHTSSHHSHNSTSGHQPHRHQNGYVNAIFAPPMPSMPFSTPSPQIVHRNPLLAWLGVDSLTQLLDRSFLFRTLVVILTILLLPPLTVVAAITSIG